MPLASVKRATTARQRANDTWKQSIVTAHAEGHSLRAIAIAAGVSHVAVLKVIRGQ